MGGGWAARFRGERVFFFGGSSSSVSAGGESGLGGGSTTAGRFLSERVRFFGGSSSVTGTPGGGESDNRRFLGILKVVENVAGQGWNEPICRTDPAPRSGGY